MTTTPYIEPWLRGTHTEVPAVGRAVLHALDLALDDITKWTSGLSDAEVHSQPLGLPSIAFHLRHIARSTDRILTYAEGNQLNAEQLAVLKTEQTGVPNDRSSSLGWKTGVPNDGSSSLGWEAGKREPLAELLAEVEVSFLNAAGRIRTLATANFDTPRSVGRKQLSTSIGGALVHVADHTQRHTGQVVTTSKVLKALRT